MEDAETSTRDDAIRTALLDWYRREARDLPWRRTRDPYRVWLSEIMLQQTRVETVVPYYRRWLEVFPDVETLARSGEDAVLKQWEGLGYYRRARNLHRAAKQLVESGSGFPTTAAGWLGIAGVGRYTAGAVASIVFGEQVPVLDGNVKRVLARLDAIEQSIDDAKVTAALWRRAEILVPPPHPDVSPKPSSPNDPGDFNQALMELGARICVPRRPRCLLCPVEAVCRGRAAGLAPMLPVRAKKGAVPHRVWVAALIVRRGRILFAQRPPGLLGGLWELPTRAVAEDEARSSVVERLLVEDLGLTGRVGEEVAQVNHAFTHFRVTIHLFAVAGVGGRARAIRHQEVRWQPRDELESLALPVAMRRLTRRVLAQS